MQGMLKDARPDRFEDIIALVALYRPGPMDLIPDFCKRKHGEKFDYPDPRTESILSETYGIMVYQEQVMQMAQIVGGYSLGGADMLRRAMGKKKAEEMAEHREIFRAGAAKDGLTTEKADEIFDLMEKFAGYGFNKSHAAAYALLSYHTAYLKAHHTAAFMAANMSLAMDDTDKIKILVEDCDGSLQADLAAAGHQRIAITASRRSGAAPSVTGKQVTQDPLWPGRREGLGPGRDRSDHRRARGGRPVHGPVRLLQAGRPQADQPPHHRVADPRRRHRLLRASTAPSCWRRSRSRWKWPTRPPRRPTRSACSAATTADLVAPPEYVKARRGPTSQKLTEEKIALGFYLSGHMFDSYAPEARRFARTKLSDLSPSREPRMMCGVITGLRTQMTQRGKILIVTLDDKSGVVEVTVYSEVFDANKNIFKEDEFLAVVGKVSEDRFNRRPAHHGRERLRHHRRARAVWPPAGPDLAGHPGRQAHPRRDHAAPRRRRACRSPRGSARKASVACCSLGDEWQVAPSDELQMALEQMLGAQEVAVEY